MISLKNGEYEFVVSFLFRYLGHMASIWFFISLLDIVDCFSDVFCRYSLGTNPRGVKDICIIYFSYYT